MESSRPGVVLDSNVWIAFLHKEDSQYKKAQGLFDELKEYILVPEYVLVEVASVLKNYKRNVEALEFVRATLENTSTLIPAGSLAHEAGALFCQRNDKLSFTDTALLVISREYRVITFDRALARAIASDGRSKR